MWQAGNLYVDGLVRGAPLILTAQGGFLTGSLTFEKSPSQAENETRALVARQPSVTTYLLSSDWISCAGSNSCWGSFGCRSATDKIVAGGLQTDRLHTDMTMVQSYPVNDREWFVESVNNGVTTLRYRIWVMCASSSVEHVTPPSARTGAKVKRPRSRSRN